jgi:hypothetical protein
MLLVLQSWDLELTKNKTITCTKHRPDVMLSGVVGSAQNPKIFFPANLVAMTNSFQKDGRLNGYRTALAIDITHSRAFMVAQSAGGSPFDMVASSPARAHRWIPPEQGYGQKPGSSMGPRPIMTTDYVLRAPRNDRKPGDVLEALKTARATTRSPAYVW